MGDLATTLRSFPSNLPILEGLLEPAPGAPDRPDRPLRTARISSPAERAVRERERGFIGRDFEALVDYTPLAAETPETLARLREKHPIGASSPFHTRSRPPPLLPTSNRRLK